MSNVRDPETDQKLPEPGGEFVQLAMLVEIDRLEEQSLLDVDICRALRNGIMARRELGISKYGTPLQTHNGRDALLECWDETIDLVTYLYQLEMEEGDATLLLNTAKGLLVRITRRRLNRGDVI